MPTNVKPEYIAAEKKYHKAESIQDKIKALEEMISAAPAHKGGENLRADLKSRLAKFRSQLEKERQQKGKGYSISVKREGSAQVALVSLTNAGKSTLLSKLTNATPEIADYGFTTKMPEVGIMDYGGVKIQLIEMPSLHPDYAYKNNGPSFFAIIRNVDLIVFILDLTKNIQDQLNLIYDEFEKAQIRINKKRPPVRVKRTGSGGISFVNREKLQATDEEVMKMLQTSGVYNAIIDISEKINLEIFQDALNESISYLPAIYVYNKKDITNFEYHVFKISAKEGDNVDLLKESIWKELKLIRVFTKQPGKEKEYPPVALKQDSSIKDLAENVHKDFVKKFTFARVWGKSAKHDGQRVGIEHKLKDMDIVELHTK